MGTGIKIRAFQQGIYQQSSTAKETLGRVRYMDDGRKFVYCKAGAANLTAGKVNVREALNASWINETGVAATTAVGTKHLTLTITAAGAAITENQFAGGFLVINDGTGEGQNYLIEYNSAVASSGTSINITLKEAIRDALGTGSDFTIVSQPGWKVTESASSSLAIPVGVAPIDVTAAYYFWNQQKGVSSVLADASAPAAGLKTCVSDVTAGSVKTLATLTYPVVGYYLEASVSGEYNPMMLMIDC